MIMSPFAMSGTNSERCASRESFFAATSCRIAVAVKLFVTLAIRTWSSIAIVAFGSVRSPVP